MLNNYMDGLHKVIINLNDIATTFEIQYSEFNRL